MAKTKAKPAEQLPAKPYEVTARDAADLKAFSERRRNAPKATRYKVGKNNHLAVEHPEAKVGEVQTMLALATTDSNLFDAFLHHMAQTTGAGDNISERGFNRTLAVVRGIAPRDPVETMLAIQMAAVHDAMLRSARYGLNSESLPQHDSAMNAMNKLARTFSAQVEALKKHRSAGEQTVRVEHVNVYPGGQAIVGNVNRGEGVPLKTEAQSHEPETAAAIGADASSTPMLGHVEADGAVLPFTGGTGQERVPVPRSQSRSAKGAA